MLDLRPKGGGFEPHRRHSVVSLSKNINPSLVLVQPRKTRPFITERLLMGRKESNQTNKYVTSQGSLKKYRWSDPGNTLLSSLGHNSHWGTILIVIFVPFCEERTLGPHLFAVGGGWDGLENESMQNIDDQSRRSGGIGLVSLIGLPGS